MSDPEQRKDKPAGHNARLINIIKKTAAAGALTGLLILLAVILLNIAYPNPLFSIMTLIGIALSVLSLLLYLLVWCLGLKSAWQKKDRLSVFIMLISMLIGLLLLLFKQS